MEQYATFKSNINNEYEHLPYDINTKIIEFIEQLKRNHDNIATNNLSIISSGKHSSYHKIFIVYNHEKYLINKELNKKLITDSGMLNRLVKQNFDVIVRYMVGG